MRRAVYMAIALLVSALAFSSPAAAAPTPGDVPRMTIDELKAQQSNPDVIVLDVRSTHDWEDTSTMIKGAIREDPTKMGSWIDKYPKDKTFALYCN
jgi:hypothetical protein